MGDNIEALKGNRRKITILERQFENYKKELANLIMYLYGMEEFDSIIPIIKDQYAID